MGFFSELKQRKVYQVAAIYAAVAWGLLQVPLFELLGSGPGRKEHVVYDAGHVGYPVSQQRREIIDWLDTWLGPVR